MPQNQSTNERYFRLVMFMFIVTLAIAWESWLLLILAIIPLVTGVIGFCPIYAVMGYSTLESAEDNNT